LDQMLQQESHTNCSVITSATHATTKSVCQHQQAQQQQQQNNNNSNTENHKHKQKPSKQIKRQ